jgi:hypothetical protein
MESQNKEFAVFSLNILRFPSFQSCLVLPQHIRNICAFRLEQLQKKWAPKYLNRSHAMHQFEEGQLTRLIEYLRTVEKPHNEAFEMPRLHNDFKQFYNQYDIRRNKNFTKTFPELESWYEEL